MAKGVKISIIVPVYNVKGYLGRCVESIMGQSYKNLEIILIDDGSTDGSEKICDFYRKKDERIIVVHKKNGGLSDARNVGIEHATGKYLFFIDSDDWIDKRTIELLLGVAIKNHSDLVECGFKEIYGDYINIGYSCDASMKSVSHIEALEDVLQWKKIKSVAWNKLYAREVIGDIRYPVGKLHEDEFTTYKFLYNAKKIVFLNLALYNYDRTKEDGLTTKFRPSNMDACEAMRQKMHFVMEHRELEHLVDMACNIYCFTLFDNLMKSVDCHVDDSREVKEAIKKALEEKRMLAKRKIEPLYKQCLSMLRVDNVKSCVLLWKKKKGLM